MFSLFPIVKMNANYAEICRVGNLKAHFQQIPLVHFFWNFHNIAVKHQYFKVSEKKSWEYFLRQKLQKSLYYRKCIGQTNFWPYNWILL